MNKISDYIFRQLFPNFNLRPVDYVLFPSHPFFLKAQLVEKDGVFTFSMECPASFADSLTVRFHLRYRLDRTSISENRLVAYMELLDRDSVTITRLKNTALFADMNSDNPQNTNEWLNTKTINLRPYTGASLDAELKRILNEYEVSSLFSPLMTAINEVDYSRCEELFIQRLYGLNEVVIDVSVILTKLEDDKASTVWIKKLSIQDPCDQSSLYAFADKILNPPLVNK